MEDNGTLLKNIGMQLQNFSLQIQNMGTQISIINPNFGIQMKNIASQISSLSMQIFNIGMQMPNINQMQNNNNFFQFPNFFNQMQNLEMINHFQQTENIYNMNNLNNLNELDKGPKYNICFHNKNNNQKINIIISTKKTIEDLFNLFKLKIGENQEFIDNHYFLFNGKIIAANDKMNIIEYGLSDRCTIVYCKKQNILGGPYFKINIYDKNFYLSSDNIYNYLIKYLEKTNCKENLEQKIKYFNVNVFTFFQTIAEKYNQC